MAQEIDVVWLPSEQWDPQGRAVAVIDVLRATSVAVTALENGARAVVPVADPSSARRAFDAFEPGSALLGGERQNVRLPGFHFGNSPAEYTRAAVAGKVIVTTTTNGTRALLSARGAARLAAAALLNGPAVAEWCLRTGLPCTLLCAGSEGRCSLEDVVCAGLIGQEFARRAAAAGEAVIWTDGARAAALVAAAYAAEPGRALRESAHGQRLARSGFAEDLARCGAWGVTEVVPEWAGDRLVLGGPQAGNQRPVRRGSDGKSGLWPPGRDRESTDG
ncbi:MAG TPA: 2-phosphosulfolactate phosphatase [Limnochordia bacterium]